MNTPVTVTPARALLDVIQPIAAGQPAPTDAIADQAMKDFLADITAIDKKHNKGKTLTQDQLAEQVFRRNPIFKDEKQLTPYMRYQLRVALEELQILDRDMRSASNGSLKFQVLMQFKDIIRDYLFDLREILQFLQRNVVNWEFFDGGKNAGVTSWEVYLLARGLAYQSTYTEAGSPFSHKTAQIASLFVLRQAMELRFERLIAVYPTDPTGKPPKLRHGFHQDFIAANPSLFQANGFKIKELRHVYDWCSEIVHQAYQPYAWQISMALRRGGDLLRSQPASTGQAWSIFNAVQINDVGLMQSTYENHFLDTYGHGKWQFTRTKPEALVPNWKQDMAFTSSQFRSVVNRPSFRARIKSLFKRLMRF